MVSATDGSAFTGSVTVSVCGDAGTQATGSVGAGACTHEGNGYHTYAPAQAETNYTLIAFTFTGTGAVPVTVQVFTTGFDPTAAVVPANTTQFGGSNITSASGIPEVKVASIAANAITATSINADAITDAKVASDVTIASVTGAVGSVTGNVGGNVTGSVGSIATGGIAAASFAAGAIDAAAIAADAIGSSELAASAVTEIQSGLATSSALSTLQTDVTTLLGRITSGLFTGITSLAQWLGAMAGKQTANSTARTELRATGAGSGTFDETTDSQEALRDSALTAAQVNAEADTALSDVGLTPTITGRIDVAVSTRLAASGYTAPLDAAGTRTAVGLASANLDTQLAAANNGTPPSAAAIADAVWDEVLSGHLTGGTTGAGLNAAGSAGDPWATALPGAYSAGSAGKILGDNLNATVASRLATSGYTAPLDAAGVRTALGMGSANLDTQIDALPTNAELATALAAADDAVLAAIAALSIPTAAQNAAALLDTSNGIETGLTPRQAMRLIVAAAAGKLSGAATTTIVIRNAVADSKDRVTATVDADGNRSAVTVDLT